MMALAGAELEMLVSEPDALTTQSPLLAGNLCSSCFKNELLHTSGQLRRTLLKLTNIICLDHALFCRVNVCFESRN